MFWSGSCKLGGFVGLWTGSEWVGVNTKPNWLKSKRRSATYQTFFSTWVVDEHKLKGITLQEEFTWKYLLLSGNTKFIGNLLLSTKGQIRHWSLNMWGRNLQTKEVFLVLCSLDLWIDLKLEFLGNVVFLLLIVRTWMWEKIVGFTPVP